MTPVAVALAQNALRTALEDVGTRFDEQLPALLAEGYTIAAMVQFMGRTERRIIQVHGVMRDLQSPTMVVREVVITTTPEGNVSTVERAIEGGRPLAEYLKLYPKQDYMTVAAPFEIAAALARKGGN